MGKKTKVIMGAIAICTMIVSSYFIFSSKEVKMNTFSESSQIVKDIPKDNKFYTEVEIKRYIHRMTHPFVKAGVKWYVSIEPTKENIDFLLNQIQTNHYVFEGKDDKVIKILNEFKEGNFKHASILHNIVWELEDGEVGKSRGIDKKAIKEFKEKYNY